MCFVSKFNYPDYVEKLNALIEDETGEDAEEEAKTYPVYSIEDFLDEVYMSEIEYNRLVSVLKNKKNVILQGAPGVGKTYAAKRLAYSMMGVKDIDRVMMVQFHQSYSYEDFIMGFRPTNDGFETDGFQKYKMELDNEKFDRLIHCVENLNKAIAEDDSLGEGFCIGHSYFCNLKPDEIDDQRLSEIVEFEIIPLLKEYWFDEPINVEEWSDKLRSALK